MKNWISKSIVRPGCLFLSRLNLFCKIVIGLISFTGVAGMIAMVFALVYIHPVPASIDQVVFGQRNEEDLEFSVITPKKTNGLALIFIVCGNWESIDMHDYNTRHTSFYVRKGYTIFKLYHADQPHASVPEILADVHRGVRFVRLNAKQWNVDPNRIGLFGRSSGGQLALCVATQSDDGDPNAVDPVDRQSSHVQACGVFYPICDLLNWEHGYADHPPVYEEINFGPRAGEPDKWPQIAHAMSPIFHIHSGMPPIMISHGDADIDVPIEQVYRFKRLSEEVGVAVKLVVNPGKTHHYDRFTMFSDRIRFAAFFEKTLKP